MRILYVGIDDPLDWSRRQILTAAGYVVTDAREPAQVEQALEKGPRLAILSNLILRTERNRIAALISSNAPGLLTLVFFSSFDTAPENAEILPPHLSPSEFLKIVGTALMKQHHHPEIKSDYFLYVDHRRRYTHVSDGVCHLTGFTREEIVGQSIEWLTYPSTNSVPEQFREYLKSKKMSGSYVLRNKEGEPVHVRFDATILPDGCLCSELTPE
jgi:PAS domain S-box-containing protein